MSMDISAKVKKYAKVKCPKKENKAKWFAKQLASESLHGSSNSHKVLLV